jgi:hypothetical protein
VSVNICPPSSLRITDTALYLVSSPRSGLELTLFGYLGFLTEYSRLLSRIQDLSSIPQPTLPVFSTASLSQPSIVCLESGLVELIDNNCQQSSAAPFTAESPCLSQFPALPVSRHCHFIVSDSCKGVVYLPSSSQAPPRSPFPVRQSVQRQRHHQGQEKSTLLHRPSLHTGSTLQPLAAGAPWLLCFASLVLSLSPHQLALKYIQRYTTKRFTDTTYCRTAFLNPALPGCRVAFASALCLSVLSEWTRLRAIHCPTPGLAAPGLGDPSLAIFPANLTSFTFAPETWPRYGYRLHSSTSPSPFPFPSTFAFLIFIPIFDPTSSNSRKIRVKPHS